MLRLWEMRSIPSLPLLPGPLWPGMVAPDKGPIYGLNRTKLHTYTKLNYLKWNCFEILQCVDKNYTDSKLNSLTKLNILK